MSKMLNKMPDVKYSITRLGGGQTPQGISYPGGLDLTTPSLSLQPGAVKLSQNFECSQSGGYSRIQGYERFDGRTSPSDATYRIIQFNTFLLTPSIGDTLTQTTSGATGKVIAVNTMAGSAYVAITQATGTFDSVHTVGNGSGTIGTPVAQNVIIDSRTNAQYIAAAANVYRALIEAVPGSGPIYDCFALVVSGVDNVYAFRANAGNTAVLLWKASAAGWVTVPLLSVVSFTVGSVLPVEGDTLTQGGVTALIRRVMWASGTTGATTAAGTMVISGIAGGNFAAGAATSTSGGVFDLVGIQTAIAITPGGNWEHAKTSFGGALGTRRVYGCDGVNKGYEFDGTIYAPISTGASPDAPKHVAIHKGYLIFSTNGSIQGSGPNLPYKWTATDGAWEIATSEAPTGMVTAPGTQNTATLAVFMKENTGFLYGTDRTTFQFIEFNNGIGAIAGSVQNLFDVFVFDPLGILTVQTTLNFGNFSSSTLTKNILPFIIQERTKVATSCVYHTKSQYRVFCNDGYALYLTMVNQQYLGAMPILYPNPVKCIDVSDTSNSNEVMYFGSSDSLGYVYQNDVGTSFDGAAIAAYFLLAWDPIKSPRVLKRLRAASIEMQGNSFAEISFGYNLAYGNQANVSQPGSITVPSGFSAVPLWDAFIWDNFIWDGQTLSPTDVDLGGTAENIQAAISCTSDYIDTFTINSIIYHYTPRRGLRV